MKTTLLTALFALSTALHGQTWFTLLTPEQQSPSTTVVMPAGTVYRVGDTTHDLWSASFTAPAGGISVVDFADGQNGRMQDPDRGTSKEFDILQTATDQTVMVNGVAKTVPALTVVPPPLAPKPPPAPTMVCFPYPFTVTSTLDSSQNLILTIATPK